MSTRVVEEIDDWGSEPFSGGYARLHELADEGFSGVVQSMAAKLCFLNGTAVGILDGSIDDFEEGNGTVYQAPSPALPLLALMQERSDEVKAKYYTEDTPISDVDSTLSDGGFSGFIELSENVLSGDYYVVYHAGRSMAVAYVGNSGQLLTDDEAFERADDEVGIYQVRPVDVDPVEIPDPDGGAAATATPDSGAGTSGTDTTPTGTGAESDATTRGAANAGGTGVDDASTGTSDTPSVASKDDAATGTNADAGASTAPTESTGNAEPTAPAEERGTTTSADDRDTGTAAEEPETARTAQDQGSTPTDTGGETTTDAGTVSARDAEADAPDANTETASSTRSESRRQSSDSPTTDAGSTDETGQTGSAAGEADSSTTRTEPADTTDAGSTESQEQSRSTESQEQSESSERASTDADRQGERSAESSRSERESRTDASSGDRSATSGRTEQRGSESGRTDEAGRQTRSTSESQGRETSGGRTGEGTGDRSTERGAGSAEVGAPGQLETRAVPSLDPSRTTSERSSDSAVGGAGVPGGAGSPAKSSRDEQPQSSRDASSKSARDGPAQTRSQGGREESQGREGADQRSTTGGEQSPSRASTDSSANHGSTDTARGREGRGNDATAGATAGQDQPSPEPRADRDQAETGSRGGEAATGQDDRVADLEAELEEIEAELERVESDLAAAKAEGDDLRNERDRLRGERDDLQEQVDRLEADQEELRAERDELREERDDLRSEVDQLRSQLQQLEDEYGAATDAEQRLSPAEALEGTHLLVRYDSKGGATLETAHDGGASRKEVRENLELGYHTEFDASTVSVAGKSFEEYLYSTIEYRFVSWVVYELMFEIRETGTVQGLQDLYDAIPKIDRVELAGEVTAEYTEEGQERRTQESFDVVLRDRQMGNPLIVANLNDSRQAATESEMNSLVTAASRVGESKGALSSAFLVTRSYFEPEALEAASQATSGGLLSRDKRQSFVKLSRKRGYQLCLAEVRDDSVHLTVPEL